MHYVNNSLRPGCGCWLEAYVSNFFGYEKRVYKKAIGDFHWRDYNTAKPISLEMCVLLNEKGAAYITDRQRN